jgi:N-methylhydantoinase A
MGLLLADLRTDFATTRLMPLSAAAIDDAEAIVAGLRRRCAAWFDEEGIAPAARRVALTVDMRYAGQNYELSVPLPGGAIDSAAIDALASGYAAMHRQLYGFVAEGEPVQLVTFRAEATGIVRKTELRPAADTGPNPRGAAIGRRNVWLSEAGEFVSCPLYARDRLAAGNRIEGPAIVEQMDATTFLPLGAVATVDAFLNLIVELP